MGQQIVGRARFEGETHEGTIELESEEIVFRGERRLRLPFAGIAAAVVEDGWLVLQTPKGEVRLEAGERAEKWAERIRNPRTLMDKLGVKPGMLISLDGIDDAAFESDLAAQGAAVRRDDPAGADIVFLYAPSTAELAALERLRHQIKKNGAVWVISPKGDRSIQDIHVMAAGKAAGLVDNKVARFSDRLTALRFVVPLKDR